MPQTTVYRPTPTNPTTTDTHPTGRATVEESDDLLDEIDSVLEENALEVTRTYVQRGGE